MEPTTSGPRMTSGMQRIFLASLALVAEMALLLNPLGCAQIQVAGHRAWTGIASLGSTSPAQPSEPTHQQGQPTQGQVREDVVRFAQSFFAILSQAFDSIQRSTKSPEMRLRVQQPKVAYCNALVDIALGPQPEANLLDMVVLVTLLHAVVKDYWVPQVYGASGEPLLAATEHGEKEIWSIASELLSPGQQQALAALIAQWRANHPKQVYVAEVRLGTFAKEFGSTAVAPLEHTSRFLPEVAEATRSIDEFRLLSERLLLYMQQAPALFVMQAQLGEYELAAEQETRDLLNSVTTFSQASDRVAKSVESLPAAVAAERRAAIVQLMTAVAAEREQALNQAVNHFKSEEKALFAELQSSNQPSRELLGEMKVTLATAVQLVSQVRGSLDAFDKLAVKMGWASPNSPPFEIKDYQRAAAELGQTARDLTELTRESRATVTTWIWLAALAAAAVILFAAATVVTAALVYRRLARPSNL